MYHTATGRVIMTVDPAKVKASRKKLRREVALAMAGEMTRAQVDASYMTMRAHMEKGNSENLLRRMDAFYKALWGTEPKGSGES